ncbi:hypothetical protein L3Q72_07220 [Vibrio sp. JC009]|uniref:hypothetical protein n=1 Tax=Vibrio sp. JC009 TaxID=2912314 RepID=UPI0023AFFE54|nr:hypothetical protein [Vibrio sp. JC009]WED23176.1 hypothetical protein L3Q72_07220 [Vibrio sp. JC009]
MESASKKVFIKNNERLIEDLTHECITEIAKELIERGYTEVDLALDKDIKPGVTNYVVKKLNEKFHEFGWEAELHSDPTMTRIQGVIR